MINLEDILGLSLLSWSPEQAFVTQHFVGEFKELEINKTRKQPVLTLLFCHLTWIYLCCDELSYNLSVRDRLQISLLKLSESKQVN